MTPHDIKSLIPSHIEACLFDLDGTLADTMPTHIIAWERTGDYFGVKITEQDINALAGAPTHEVIITLNEKYGWDVDPQLAKELKAKYYLELLDAATGVDPIMPVFDFAIAFLDVYKMAIGTGSSRSNGIRVMEAINMIEKIPHIVSADDVINPKPHPETFTKCADIIGVPYENCIVFEDGPMGVLSAHAAGMPVIFLPQYEFLPAH
jgi:beta-phosphoglucomutase-like phosphatase (HAD superfamily)